MADTLKIFTILALKITLILLLASCTATINPDIQRIDDLLSKEIALERLPGAVIQIKQKDSVLVSKAYGYAYKLDFDSTVVDLPEKMSTGHMFDLASLTKVCATTFGVMLLVDQNKISLDDSLSRYFDGFKTPEKQAITIRHLLTHTAGLAQWVPTYYHASTPEERRAYSASLPLKWPIGQERHYSDLGFMLLGDVIEKVSGKSFDKYLKTALYAKLEMNKTTFKPLKHGVRPEQIAATSHGNPFEKRMVYDDDFGYEIGVDLASWDGWRQYTLCGEVNDGNAYYANQGTAGHAGLFSTVSDLQKLANLLLQNGRWKDKQIISEDIIEQFLTRDSHNNGLGWAMDKEIISANGTTEQTFGHTGFTGTSIVIIPEHQLSVILLTNRQHYGSEENGYYYNLGPLRQKIIDAVMRESFMFW